MPLVQTLGNRVILPELRTPAEMGICTDGRPFSFAYRAANRNEDEKRALDLGQVMLLVLWRASTCMHPIQDPICSPASHPGLKASCGILSQATQQSGEELCRPRKVVSSQAMLGLNAPY
eukprot:scaffold293052_cov47-Prasinocladus_malaysianus.AAC.1